MARPGTTLEAARMRYVGRIIHDKEIVEVTGAYEDSSGKHRWMVLARCPHCGGLFEKRLQTLLANPRTNCGCQNKRRGQKLKALMGYGLTKKAKASEGRPLPKKKAKEKEQKARKSRARWSTPESATMFTKNRVRAFWSELNPALLCPAWQDFEKFYTWAVWNGYVNGRGLLWTDRTKLMGPTSCRWERK